ncbi:MAG TPA: hypothetical protein VGD67_20260 [Pseudonocardiaceae bacterium]
MDDLERTPPGGGRMAVETSPQRVEPERYDETVAPDAVAVIREAQRRSNEDRGQSTEDRRSTEDTTRADPRAEPPD